jgi:hypothetical protein
MFNDLKCLKHLDLSKVELDDHVLPGLFSELKQLVTLILNWTRLLPVQDAFIYYENLKELHFIDANKMQFFKITDVSDMFNSNMMRMMKRTMAKCNPPINFLDLPF